MTSDCKKPGMAFWATVVVVVALVAYPLSFGPACWVTSRLDAGAGILPAVYRPIIGTLSPDWDTDSRLNAAIFWYANFGAARGWYWDLANLNGEIEWKWEFAGPDF
jgi:hypothetical protein